MALYYLNIRDLTWSDPHKKPRAGGAGAGFFAGGGSGFGVGVEFVELLFDGFLRAAGGQ